MVDPSVSRRAAELVAATTARVSEMRAELIRRYATGVHLGGSRGTQENALVDLREFCRLIEQARLEVISYRSLIALAEIPAPSPTAARRRRRVVDRLIRLLQHSGELPTPKELRASDAIEQTIAAMPTNDRGILRSWLAQRRRTVGWWELRWEARRLQQLELVIGEHPDADDDELITRWLCAIVRQIVDCGCPPVTRRRDPAVCSCCGKTRASHGSRPSPSERKQREYSVVARRYLEHRRFATSRSLG